MKLRFVVECEVSDTYIERKAERRMRFWAASEQAVDRYRAYIRDDVENALSDALVFKDYVEGTRPVVRDIEPLIQDMLALAQAHETWALESPEASATEIYSSGAMFERIRTWLRRLGVIIPALRRLIAH